jgi:hypothetical protein
VEIAPFPGHESAWGKGRSKGSRSVSWVEYRTLWDGVSVVLTLHLHPRESPDKRGKVSMSLSQAGPPFLGSTNRIGREGR